MKILVAGSRNHVSDIWTEELYEMLELAIDSDPDDSDTIISGGARGVDYIAELFAREHGIDFDEHPAEWDKYGKCAGYRRNAEMVALCDKAYVLWDGYSKGTKHTIDLLIRAEIPYILITSFKKESK